MKSALSSQFRSSFANKLALSALSLKLFIVAALGQQTAATNIIRSGGIERTFMLHVGKGVHPAQPAALVLVLHGSGGTGEKMERSTGFDKIADREGFIVVYPSGIATHWNDGRRATRFDVVKDIDDIQCLRDIVAEVARTHRVNEKRIYCTGLSNGGFMSNRAGVEAPDLFAAIAPVSGTLGVAYTDRITPAVPISVLVIHGTKDGTVHYEGGEIGTDGPAGMCLGVPDIVTKWVHANQIATAAVTTTLPDKDPDDGCRVTQSVYGGSKATVELLAIDGGIHAWPGASSHKKGVCHDIDGSEFIWAFFKSHPKP